MKAATIGCAETSIGNYHSSLRDNPDEKSSHHVWLSSKDKVFVTISVKRGKTIPQLKNKRNKKVT
jgi:hypothetical protein